MLAPRVRPTLSPWRIWALRAESAPCTSTDVIANTTGINALLDGHSHSILEQEKVKNKDGEEVLLAACGTKLASHRIPAHFRQGRQRGDRPVQVGYLQYRFAA